MKNPGASRAGELTVEHFGYTQELKRVLGVTDLVILGLCMAVPISVSVIYGYVVQAAAGSVATVYLLAAIGMLLTGNSYARLAEAFPLAGGGYAFVSRGLSRLAGFLIGWAMAGMYIVLLPLLYIFGAYALQAMLPAVPVQVWLLAFIVDQHLGQLPWPRGHPEHPEVHPRCGALDLPVDGDCLPGGGGARS